MAVGGWRGAAGGLLPLRAHAGRRRHAEAGRRRLRAAAPLRPLPLLRRRAHRPLCEYRGAAGTASPGASISFHFIFKLLFCSDGSKCVWVFPGAVGWSSFNSQHQRNNGVLRAGGDPVGPQAREACRTPGSAGLGPPRVAQRRSWPHHVGDAGRSARLQWGAPDLALAGARSTHASWDWPPQRCAVGVPVAGSRARLVGKSSAAMPWPLDGGPCWGGGGGGALGAMQNKHSCPLGCVVAGLAGHSAHPGPSPLLPAPTGAAGLLGPLPTCSYAAPEPPGGDHGQRARVTPGSSCPPRLWPSGRGAAPSARLSPEPFGRRWLQMPALRPGVGSVLPTPAPTWRSESLDVLVPSLLPGLLRADRQSGPGWRRRRLSIASVPSRSWARVPSRRLG